MQGSWKWYLTIAAVREWMRITKRSGPLEMSNPDFIDAQNELGDISIIATLSIEASEKERNGSQVYRTGKIPVKGGSKTRRVECYVMPPVRGEGPLPQLVRVRIK